MVVLLEGSPISTDKLWSSVRVTIGFLVSSLTKALLPRLFSWAERSALGRVLVVPNIFHLRMMAPVFLGTLNAADCGILYRQLPFTNHIQSIEFTTGGLQSSCRNISRMINGNRTHLSSI